MLLKTRGVILRSIKYSETSIIADILTEEKGLHTFIIGGVRSPKSKVGAAIMQVTSLVDLVSYFREDRDMHRIKEIKQAHVYQHVLFDVRKSSVALFMAELCKSTIFSGEENRDLFRYVFNSFVQLDTQKESIANYHLAFMIHLTTFLGFQPGGHMESDEFHFDLREGHFTKGVIGHTQFLNKEESIVLDKLMELLPGRSHELLINKPLRKRFLEHLIQYYQYHIDGMRDLQSHKILETVLA